MKKSVFELAICFKKFFMSINYFDSMNQNNLPNIFSDFCQKMEHSWNYSIFNIFTIRIMRSHNENCEKKIKLGNMDFFLSNNLKTFFPFLKNFKDGCCSITMHWNYLSHWRSKFFSICQKGSILLILEIIF